MRTMLLFAIPFVFALAGGPALAVPASGRHTSLLSLALSFWS
ncbi:exported hypothetical protein [Acidobacteriia bacterium SbA2]|nr:exported hypothetical protein [Acidobacteriia bacterium SbA2]